MNFIDQDNWNQDQTDNSGKIEYKSLVVYSRDWTVETIVNQMVTQKSIDLNPKFQRRNAWTDEKRSKLIESLMISIPVPEIVLAEHPEKKKSFLVIDGKQRLLTIAGFMYPLNYAYWTEPVLQNLTGARLNGVSYEKLKNDPTFIDDLRELHNADVRCTVISNYNSIDVLYDIFYRLNTGSVSLSSQELRQVLKRGEFADYLMEITSVIQPIHYALGLDEPDTRLRDVEMILRFISFVLFGREYRGNLRLFLDECMGNISENWANYQKEIKALYERYNESIVRLSDVLGYNHMGRKFSKGKWENRFNKVLFEVEVYYFSKIAQSIQPNQQKMFIDNFKEFCSDNLDFRKSIEIATNNIESYQKRFILFRDFMNNTMSTNISDHPLHD